MSLVCMYAKVEQFSRKLMYFLSNELISLRKYIGTIVFFHFNDNTSNDNTSIVTRVKGIFCDVNKISKVQFAKKSINVK